MQRTWNWKFATRVAAALIPGLFFVIMPIELWGALTAPQEYRFGGEGPAAGMWAYKSQANYVTSCTASWLTSGMALWGLLTRRTSLLARCLWCVSFLIVWALNVFDGSRLE
jgi:hypothetical protein